VYALTPGGAALARRIAGELGGVVYLPDRLCAAGAQPFASLAELVARTFRLHPGHVFVAATGIVVRCIAPHITTKTDDPCVVVCDQRGAHAISLLSGHLGGGNDLARRVAAVTGGVPVITTATDTEGLPSFDLLAARAGLAMADIAMVRHVGGALLAGEPVWVCDPEDRLGLRATGPVPGIAAPDRPSPPHISSPHISARFRFVNAPGDLPPEAPSVLVTPYNHLAAPRRLVLHPRVLHVGVGCKRGIDGAVIEARIREALSDAHLAPASIAALASADLKADEPGLRRAAAALGADLHFFDAAGLAAVPVPHPSPKAAEVLDVARVGVAEAAALLSARHARADAALLVPKSAGQGVTVAVAAPVDTSGPPPSPHSTASETTP
jgi:cobalt-precorrin 5A hydrolase